MINEKPLADYAEHHRLAELLERNNPRYYNLPKESLNMLGKAQDAYLNFLNWLGPTTRKVMFTLTCATAGYMMALGCHNYEASKRVLEGSKQMMAPQTLEQMTDRELAELPALIRNGYKPLNTETKKSQNYDLYSRQ